MLREAVLMVSAAFLFGIKSLSRELLIVPQRNAKRTMSSAENGIFCRWTAERLHLTCYPAFVPALSEWRPKRVRFIGMEN